MRRLENDNTRDSNVVDSSDADHQCGVSYSYDDGKMSITINSPQLSIFLKIAETKFQYEHGSKLITWPCPRLLEIDGQFLSPIQSSNSYTCNYGGYWGWCIAGRIFSSVFVLDLVLTKDPGGKPDLTPMAEAYDRLLIFVDSVIPAPNSPQLQSKGVGIISELGAFPTPIVGEIGTPSYEL